MLDISPVRLIEQLARLQISYNLCNLPTQITTVNGKTVKYTYFADGTKFKVVDAAGSGFVYTGSLRWSVENGALVPESIAITGGRAVFADNSWATNYYITDHLGSVRAVTDAEGEVLDTFDYMPYGSEISSRSSATTDYRFTGKERQSMVNNSIYDSFARFQNTYGRFMSIDPKAESFYHISPYTYCAGDPVNLVDPDGMWYVKVSASADRGRNPYAIYSVYDKNNILIYQTVVKVTGIGGRDRTAQRSDTPTGRYKILNWRETGNARYNIRSYGPNPLLALEYESGEAFSHGRSGMHTHGGGNQGNNPEQLKNTEGCIRMADVDIKELKTIVDALVDDDPEYLEVTNDLNRELHFSDRDEIKSEYVRNGGTIEPIEIVGYKDSYNYAYFFDFFHYGNYWNH